MDTAAALIAQNAAFADLVDGADQTVTVPTCPEWSLKQLVRHLGRGDRWAATIVAERSAEYVDPRAVEDGTPRDDQTDWLLGGVRVLLDAVDRTGAQTPVWTFLGPRPAGWWIRRRLHETVVHRADAALALGRPFGVDPEIAADAISEYLERAVIRAGGDRPLAPGQSLHLHATDQHLGTAGEWTILGRPDGIAVDHEHGKATAAVRGPARDLLLALVRRGTVAELGLELHGDDTVWKTWLARTPF